MKTRSELIAARKVWQVHTNATPGALLFEGVKTKCLAFIRDHYGMRKYKNGTVTLGYVIWEKAANEMPEPAPVIVSKNKSAFHIGADWIDAFGDRVTSVCLERDKRVIAHAFFRNGHVWRRDFCSVPEKTFDRGARMAMRRSSPVKY